MPLHTVEEAAELMKVSPDTVREWVRSGRLRASKLAGSKTLRISTDDIMAFYDGPNLPKGVSGFVGADLRPSCQERTEI